jgi:hypothetical protein
VTKFQLVLTSLVAVIPGAFLIFLLVTAMLQFSDKMSVIAYVIVGSTLLSMVITVLMPLGIMFGGGRKAVASKTAAAKKSSHDTGTLDEDIDLGGESVESIDVDESFDDSDMDSMEGASEDDLHIATSEFDLGESFDAMDAVDDESMIATDPVEDYDSIEIDADDFEEEPKPPKKKKR